jgi:hypothetical protein
MDSAGRIEPHIWDLDDCILPGWTERSSIRLTWNGDGDQLELMYSLSYLNARMLEYNALLPIRTPPTREDIRSLTWNFQQNDLGSCVRGRLQT